MGLFSKKDYVCEKCGKTFQKRINLNGNLCDECFDQDYIQRQALEQSVKGYIDYGKKYLSKTYTNDEMQAIIEHRARIMEANHNEDGVTRELLMYAGENYKSLTDEEAVQILGRAGMASINSVLGCAYTAGFLVPLDYDGVVVNADDVFAMGYVKDYKHSGGNVETILCAIFTNDPYIPVIPMFYQAKTGLFEFGKSKKARGTIEQAFSFFFQNLTYPIGELKQLKKQIKQEGMVRGNIEMKYMLDRIEDANIVTGLFKPDKMVNTAGEETMSVLDQMGYVLEYEIEILLKMDKMFNRNYWNKIGNRVLEMYKE